MAVPELNLKLSASEVTKGKVRLHEVLGNEKKTVCIFTNATKDKKLKKEWWTALTEAIMSEFPNVNIFEMLPKENTSQVDFKYPHYLSEDLRLMAAIIDNCEVFIGADSGVMHIGASTRRAVIGLFNGQTNPEVYGPYGPDKTYVDVNEVSVAEIIDHLKLLLDTPRG
jgi:ADP-heptose:LPS heptosyltransferase